ncbi:MULTISPECIES: AraC family transcriptional regulator [Paenibacillus]|uniref:AraC family transcriptional regulator n=1 Tax=Paenibacillus TaxID=44249 RepID=UPI00048F3264|nr:AraC family transcriptional regulator [Paenibacillus sp. IHBB 10380]
MLAMNADYVPRIKLMGFVSYKNPWIHFKRNTHEYILYFIKKGELHIQEKGIPYILRKGDLLVLEPHVDHEGIEKHTCDYYYIHFEHPCIEAVPEQPLSLLAEQWIMTNSQAPGGGNGIRKLYFPKTCSLTQKKSLHHMVHALGEMLQLYRRKHFNRTMTALKFMEMLIELSRHSLFDELEQNSPYTKTYMKVHALLDYIHEHYAEKITSADIEQRFECNYDYMNRVFAKLTGHTIMRYVNQVRINHAKELIEATHLSFGEIGYLTGLDDPFYFSKVFKKYVGISPNQYYKQVHEAE